MDPHVLNRLSGIGQDPGPLARNAETTDFVTLTCRLTLFCSTFGFVGGGVFAAEIGGVRPPVAGRMIVATPFELIARADPSESAARAEGEQPPVLLHSRSVLTQQSTSTQLGPEHPLMPVYSFATKRYSYIRSHLKDYECMVVLREHIDGELTDFQHVHMKVRSQQIEDGRVVTPYSVFIHWLGPPDIAGRKALYVAGWNDGKVRVRKGGGRFSYLKLNLSPFSETALEQSHYPITEVGMVRVAGRMVRQIADDIRADPYGANTQATFYKGAQVSGRACTRIEVVHAAKWPGLIFHKANLFIDDKLHLPIRIESYDWPSEETGEAELVEEYTYLKIRLNVGLDDEDFDPSVMN